MPRFKAIQFKIDGGHDGATGESKIIEADSHKEAVHKLYQEFKQEGPAYISPGDYQAWVISAKYLGTTGSSIALSQMQYTVLDSVAYRGSNPEIHPGK